MRLLFRFALLLALCAAVAVPRAAVEPDTFTGVERIVAVGDVHGGYDELVALLRQAKVLDRRARWIGGRTHLVQTGDLLDRGPHSKKVMDLLMRLEGQALKAGGRVHALLGNHEVMNLLGDLRYVSPGEYAAFVTSQSEDVRQRAYALLADPVRKDDRFYRQQWEAQHPLGWVEHRLAFGSSGKYGNWLRERNTVVKIDDYLFLHGGISPRLAESSVREINERVRAELQQQEPLTSGLVIDADGPLWYRGLALDPPQTLGPHLDRVLAHYGVKHIVVSHTTTPGAVLPRMDGKVLLIDVGLSEHYGARPACLVVERSTPYALHRGDMLRLPMGPGANLVHYLRAAAALDPPPSPLNALIAAGGRFPLDPGAPQER
jgi:hypothetical protein